MKISLNWLKEYVEFDLEIEELSSLLTQTGLEVEAYHVFETIPGSLDGLIVGKVLSTEKHPNADKLTICQVDTGNGQASQIICGASNVEAGQHVIVAPVGAKLFPVEGDPFDIKNAKIRGEVSNGMICAEDEIGLGTNHDGIMVLPSDTEPGMAVSEYFETGKDYVIEIGLTANRSDAYSHIGVARDLKAALNVRHEKKISLHMPDLSSFKVDDHSLPISVEVLNTQSCPRYSGISISNIKVGPSPKWMQARLNAIGMRPINNIVDITNYILHEYGQPLHAFDADKISGQKVIVKDGMGDQPFTTLDEVTRKLNSEDLMICNGEEGMCIAGVFGGLGSGVTESTKNIFLESAYFDPVSIRRTSTRHNLRTDAAAHFEKGTDPNITIPALKRAALLMRDIAGGKISSEIVDIYPVPVKDFKVSIRYDRINRLAGKEIDEHTVQLILAELGIDISDISEHGLELIVPSFRSDVKREADIIEEILRIYGLDHIPLPEFLRSNISPKMQSHRERMRNYISDYLCGLRFYELFTNSITQSSYIRKFLPEIEEETVFLANSLNAHLDILRPSTLFSGLEVIQYNFNRKNNDLLLFEIGKIFNKNDKGYNEEEVLSLYMTGNRNEENWRHATQAINFFDLKASVNKVLAKLGVSYNKINSSSDNLLQYGLSYCQGNTELAVFGKVKNSICRDFGIKQDVFFALIHWNRTLKLRAQREQTYQILNKFPSVRRDLSIVIDTQIPYDQVAQIAIQTAKKLLTDMILFDVFEGDAVGEGKKSYAFGLVFQHPEKTLQDKDIDKIMKQLMFRYEKELGALIRR